MLHKLLPTEGYPIAWTVRADGVSWNVVCNSVDELTASILNDDARGLTSYFCLGTVKDRMDLNADGSKNVGHKLARSEVNIHSYKSLWMDIDVGTEATKYDNAKEAWDHLKVFATAINWPLPMLVSSGTGLHAYWPLTESINLDQWRTYLPHILGAAHHANFKLDPAAVNKATQVLRLAGTHHRKDPNNIREVSIIRDCEACDFDSLMQALKTYTTTNKCDLPEQRSAATARANLTQNPWKLFAQQMGTEWTPPVKERDTAAIFRGCKQMQSVMKGGIPEPVYRGVLSITRLLPEGNALSHHVSGYDSRYRHDVTESKLSYLDGMGPYTCKQFHTLNPSNCEGCPNKGTVKSPIVLGDIKEMVEVEVEAQVIIPEPQAIATRLEELVLPVEHPPTPPVAVQTAFGSFKTDERGVRLTGDPSDPESKDVVIADQQIYPVQYLVKRGDGNSSSDEYYFKCISKTASGDESPVLIATKDLGTQAMMDKVQASGVILIGLRNRELMQTYLGRAMNTLAQQPPTPFYETLGWQESGAFVTGRRVVDSEGRTPQAVLSGVPDHQVRLHHLEPTGDYTPWREAMDVFNTPDQLHAQMAIMASYGAPLIKFAGIDGILLSLHGESGLGKSAIQYAAASIWGRPKSMREVAPGTAQGSSLNSIMHTMGVTRHMPVILEELTNMDARLMPDFVHACVGGQEKARMTQTTNNWGNQEGGTWATITISSSNDSLAEKLSTAKNDAQAERLRVFELADLKAAKRSAADQLSGAAKLKQLNTNFGHASIIYTRYLVANYENLDTWLTEASGKLQELTSARPEERIWLGGMAAIMVGAEIAHAAGLHSFDLEALESYIVKQFKAQRESLSGDRATSQAVFPNMINDHVTQAVVVNDDSRSGAIKVPTNSAVTMRIELHSGKGYISYAAAMKWARNNNVSKASLLDSGAEMEMITSRATVKCSLGKGAPHIDAGGQANCYVFDIPSDHLEEIKQSALEADLNSTEQEYLTNGTN